MNTFPKTWIGQVTTGHGCMVLLPTLLAVLSGTMSWTVAIPLLVAGVVGLAWPENIALKDAVQSATADLEAAYAQYQNHLIAAAANAPVPPDPRPAASSVAVLAAIGLSLAACTGQTPAQQAVVVQAVECIADTTARIAAAEAAPASGAVRVANAAAAVGTALSTDSACAAAEVNPAAPAAPQP